MPDTSGKHSPEDIVSGLVGIHYHALQGSIYGQFLDDAWQAEHSIAIRFG